MTRAQRIAVAAHERRQTVRRSYVQRAYGTHGLEVGRRTLLRAFVPKGIDKVEVRRLLDRIDYYLGQVCWA